MTTYSSMATVETPDGKGTRANISVGVCSFLFLWPTASLFFMFAIATHVLCGVCVLVWMPQSNESAGGVPIPEAATCLRATRYADYSTVDVMVGTPPTQLRALLRLDAVKRVDDNTRGLRLFAQGAVESTTVTCSVNGWCSDVLIVTDGGRSSHYARVSEFDYRHKAVEQSMYTTASSIAGVAGEIFMREGYAYWLTSTHFCYSGNSNTSAATERVPVTLDTTGGLVAKVRDLKANEVLSKAPAVSGDAHSCATALNSSDAENIALFPETASVEASWLSIADMGIYNTEPESVETRRAIAEIGVVCAANLTKYERDLALYQLDCAPYLRCQPGGSIPFRRVATASLFLSLEEPGSYWAWAEADKTLNGLPKLANSTSAFVASILKMLMITVAAAVVFVRSRKKTASSSWLFKNCISISNTNAPSVSTEEPAETRSEDKWVGLVAIASRFTVATLRVSTLSSDNQLRVCVLELVASALSLTHWLNRWYCLSSDTEEPAMIKLGGSTAIVDSTAAVMLAFSESPTLAMSSSKFDPTARMFVSLLISIIVLTRCAFSAACCGALWPVFWAQPDRRDYALVLLGSGLLWCIQSGILAVTMCDLFVTPAAHSMSRATVGDWVDLYILRLAIFLGTTCAGLPRLMSTSRHILSKHEHVD